MAIVQHIVTDPSGVQHVINGPDDATPEEVMAQAQQLIPRPKPGAADYAEVPLNLSGKDLAPAWPVDPAVTQAADERGRFWRELAQAAALTGAGGALGGALRAGQLAPALGRIGGSGVAALTRPASGDDTWKNRAYEAAKAMGETGLIEGAVPALSNLLGRGASLAANRPAVTETTHVRVPTPSSDPVLVTGRPPVNAIPGQPLPTADGGTLPARGGDIIKTTTRVQPKVATPALPSGMPGARALGPQGQAVLDAAGQAPMGENSRYGDLPAIAVLLSGVNRLQNWGRNKLGVGGQNTYGGYGGG